MNMMNTMKNIKKTTTFLAMLAAFGIASVTYAANNATTMTTATTTMAANVTENVGKINLNTADANAIAGKVKGIGIKRAEMIVAYRTEHGAYKSFDDLAGVRGINDAFVKSHLDTLNQVFTLS